jgi:hypothetical protein
MRVDSGCIAQALTKFPVLRQIFLGDRVMIDGKETRWSWGATRLDQFECPSGHCSIKVGSRTITIGYRTVTLALAQIGGQLEHTKLGVSLNRADCTKPQPEAYTIVWNDAAYLSSRITTLQLQVLAAQQNFNYGPVQDIVNNASIDSLRVQYEDGQVGPQDRIHLITLRMPHLRRVVLEGLWATAPAYPAFLSAHREQLTHLSLIDCSAKGYAILSERGDAWLRVLQELKQMNGIEYLELVRLHKKWVAPSRNNILYDRMDRTMSEGAVWKGRDEIQRGLAHLSGQHHDVMLLGPEVGDYDPTPVHVYYLNLRFANFKASNAYTWTSEEAKFILEYRCSNAFYYGENLKRASPLDDEAIFPVQDRRALGRRGRARTPIGYDRLPVKLWGKWETVWLSNAPLSQGNW